MDPPPPPPPPRVQLDIRTILGTIGSLTLQVNAFQDRSGNSLQTLHLHLVHLQLELTNCLTVQDRKNLFNFSVGAEKLKSWSDRLVTLHQMFEEQKGQIEDSHSIQLRKEFTASEDSLKKEIEHLKASKDSCKQQLKSAETSFNKLQAELKSSYALVQSKEECIDEAHTIHRYLERQTIASMEAKKHVEHLYRQFQREKTQLKEANQHLQNDKARLKQVDRQHQEDKLVLETALQNCELRNQKLQQNHTCKDEQLRKARKSRNKYQKKALALENEVKALKLNAALAKTNQDELNGRIRQLREAAVIVHEKLATERIATFELSEQNRELNKTVLVMKRSLRSLAEQWGVGSMSNPISNDAAAPSTPITRPNNSSSSPSMSISSRDSVQTTPVEPSRHTESSMRSWSNSNIQRNPITPSRKQSSMSSSSNQKFQGIPAIQSKQASISEKNNSNSGTPQNRSNTNTTAPVERPPRPPTDRERAHKNLDKLPLHLLQEFNEAWKKADTMVPGEGFHLVKPFIRKNPVYSSGTA